MSFVEAYLVAECILMRCDPLCLMTKTSVPWSVSCEVLCRKLSKDVQTELAGANSVAEEVLSSMTTVKAHAAERSAQAAYCYRLKLFYTLQVITRA